MKSDNHNFCFFCKQKIDSQNVSKEHIIPNAIGGSRVVSNFICEKCNKTFGSSWDAELVRQFNPLLLGIKRKRGRAPRQQFSTTNGQKYNLTPDGRPEIAKPLIEETELEGGKTRIHIRARSMSEAKAMIRGLEKKKYPHLSKLVTPEDFQESESYLHDMLHIPLSIGGKLTIRSIVKSCMAMLYSVGLHGIICENVYRFFSDAMPASAILAGCAREFVDNQADCNIFHCIHIEGIHDERVLLGYVEYFSCYKFIILLSDDYHGGDVKYTYAIDPASGKDVNLSISMNMPRDDVLQMIPCDYDVDKIKSDIDSFMRYIIGRAQKKEIDRVVHDAFEHGVNKAGLSEGDYVTGAHVPIIVEGMMEKMTPLLVHLVTRNHPPLNEDFAAQMAAAEDVMREDRDMLQELAKK